MSYQVLARKWRPKRFSEMVGQQHVLRALENALNQDRLHHAYLFTGTRGVGKTTVARIFAKCLNCVSGVSAEPCGQCNICLAIDQGNFLDLIEIDAASNTKVDQMRDLLDNVQYTPTTGKYKVYLIDEVHMLSGHSFNALLKTLEEPPPHVKFLLATTDPQKLPVTVLSRCLQFNLKAMSAVQISEHLKSLLEKEMISFEPGALALIAKAAEGSMRDALSLTDQAIAHGNEKLLTEEVRAMLGLIDEAYVQALLNALLSKDAQAMLAAIEQIARDAPDYKAVLAELIAMLHRLVLAQVRGEDEDPSVYVLATQFTAEELQLYYQIALKGRADLSIAPDPRQGMEMCLLRMLLFRPQSLVDLKSLAKSLSANPNKGANPADALKAQLEKKKSELNTEKQNSVPVKEAIVSQYNVEIETTPPVAVTSDNQSRKTILNSEVEPTPAQSGIYSYQSINDKWTKIVLNLNIDGPALMIARNANFKKTGDTTGTLIVDKKYQMLTTQQAKRDLARVLSQFFGKEIELIVEFEKPTNPTPEELCQALDKQKQQVAREKILNENTANVLINEFGAELLEGSQKLLLQ